MNSFLVTESNENGNLNRLCHSGDIFRMNWADGEIPWGSIQAPEGVKYRVERNITADGNLEERFIFQNESSYPVYFKENDLGIFISLPDRYTKADECMKKNCHTHIWCGDEASWIKAVRMSGIGPHLGMALRKGGLRGYSIRRNETMLSNDRGSFLLHPNLDVLYPEEEYELCMEWFWYNKADDFREKLLEFENFPVISADQCTYFEGEDIRFRIMGKGHADTVKIHCEGSESIEWEKQAGSGRYQITVTVRGKVPKEYPVEVEIDHVRTKALFLVLPKLGRLTDARCRFIVEHQQEVKGNLDGAFLIYDQETGKRYYSHLDDHNGGRERLAMGALLALFLQENRNTALEESLNRYIAYVYRELFDDHTGDVFNDIERNHDWDRLYNYPWVSIFLFEVYKWKVERKYLKDAYLALRRYYEKGGTAFYAIGIPAEEICIFLVKEGMEGEADILKKYLLAQAEYIRETGLHFPTSEVNYEQSIVAPAVDVLLQAYEITQEGMYLEKAEELMEVLLLFNGQQPDYHLFENSIRHWDGYWFGKRKCLGDTFPHYWSVLSGIAYERYGNVTGEIKYHKLAKASFRGSLNLFEASGMAHCAMVYPVSVNGKAGHYYDPWANDQDWALYYAWKLRNITLFPDDSTGVHAPGTSGLHKPMVRQARAEGRPLF